MPKVERRSQSNVAVVAKKPEPQQPAAAAPKEDAPESSYEPKRKKLVNTTGARKAHVPKSVNPELQAEIAARRYGWKGEGAKKTELSVTKGASEVVIKGGSANDTIRVTPRKDGKPGVDVTAGKNVITLSEEEAKKLVIDAGKGNDTILVDPKVKYDLTLRGGDGDDLIRGGAGNDKVFGGEGRDTLNGGEGGDKLEGGVGNDVLHGGGGDDTLLGGEGNDLVVGGRGADKISGGAGDNVISGGAGADQIANAGGNDKVFTQKDDTLGTAKGAKAGKTSKVAMAEDGAKPAGHTITVEGSDAFEAKVQDELDVLRSTPTGRALLEDIDKHPDKPVVIKEGTENQSLPKSEADSMEKGRTVKNVTGTGKGSGSTVTFDPDMHRAGGLASHNEGTDDDDPFTLPPALVLFHELVHSHRSQLGESKGLKEVEEWETTGTEDGKFRGERHTWKYTENQLRAELGLPDRAHYND